MAVQSKHNDRSGRVGFEHDFTTDQRHRFTEVANAAFRRRKKKEELDRPFFESARKTVFKPVLKPKKMSPSKQRQVVWIVIIGLVSLWAMYMAG
ncbi:hypothetical protein KIV40_30045, partial [Vibrio sp. D173a]|uniref:hypothetical protein n=1 Tax=unclassified Vibrio TaxID=2614977 RepID=UPI002553E3FD